MSNIILDEKKYAEKLLKYGFVKFMSIKDLTILSKYYRFKGYKSRNIKLELVDFCKKHNPVYNEILHENKVELAMKYSKKQELRESSDVLITNSELENIRKLKNHNLEKILFCMIVISRFYSRLNPEDKQNDDLYCNVKFSYIMSVAKVYSTKQERNKIINYLNTNGYIEATLTNSFKIKFADNTKTEGGVIVKDISDENLKSIITFYPVYCEDCGQRFDRKKYAKSNKCESCYSVYRKEQKLLLNKRYFSNKKLGQKT